MTKVAHVVALVTALALAAFYVLPAAGAPNPIAEAAQLITGRQIANNTITGKKIRDRSLTRRDFSGRVRGPRGPRGLRGAPGPQGVPGPINVRGIQTVAGPENTIPAFDDMTGTSFLQSSIALCPAGQSVISGGGVVATAVRDGLAVSEPTNDRSGWFVIAGNNGPVDGTVQARALCAGNGAAVVARSRRAAIRREVQRVMTRIQTLQRPAR